MIRKKAIFKLLDIHSDYNEYVILDTVVVCCYKQTYSGQRGIKFHSNSNFSITYDDLLARKYLSNITADPDMQILINFEYIDMPNKYVGDITYYNSRRDMTLLAKSGDVQVKSLYCIYKGGLDYNSSKYVCDDEYTCFILYKAVIPSEQAIIQEMQKIKSKLEL